MILRSSEITLFIPFVILCKYLCSLTKKSERKTWPEYADYTVVFPAMCVVPWKKLRGSFPC